ncbi:hypothetical protein TNCV_1124381 [Trichonephila clavipes]|uniref:Uncharacterized protein n=1 Tax=Trichonephila clavipes TaxID=2585209 RepID=A0A8X6SD07_TRICX|nr:hypothetical protein TNCV_1124381 [Trichonephila clavipes]
MSENRFSGVLNQGSISISRMTGSGIGDSLHIFPSYFHMDGTKILYLLSNVREIDHYDSGSFMVWVAVSKCLSGLSVDRDRRNAYPGYRTRLGPPGDGPSNSQLPSESHPKIENSIAKRHQSSTRSCAKAYISNIHDQSTHFINATWQTSFHVEETHTIPKIPEMSNKLNVNEVSIAHLDPKEQEVELQAVKNHCEELLDVNTELKENINRMLEKAKENIHYKKTP